MSNSANTTSPQSYARTGGVLYLFIVAAGLFAQIFVRSKLIVSGDAAATAANILANEQMFRVAFAGEILMLVFDVALALIFYVLLRPVNKNLALFAAFLRLAMAAISGVNALNHFSALIILNGGEFMSGFDASQLNALSYLSLRVHNFGYHIALVFFGFYCLTTGYLIFRSGYLPKILGGLMIIAGAGYLANSFSAIAAPQFSNMLFLLPALVAEVSLALWLTVMGVNVKRWNERAVG